MLNTYQGGCSNYSMPEQANAQEMVNISKLEPNVKRKLFDAIKRFDEDLYTYINDKGLQELRKVFGNPDLCLPREQLAKVWKKIKE